MLSTLLSYGGTRYNHTNLNPRLISLFKKKFFFAPFKNFFSFSITPRSKNRNQSLQTKQKREREREGEIPFSLSLFLQQQQNALGESPRTKSISPFPSLHRRVGKGWKMGRKRAAIKAIFAAYIYPLPSLLRALLSFIHLFGVSGWGGG